MKAERFLPNLTPRTRVIALASTLLGLSACGDTQKIEGKKDATSRVSEKPKPKSSSSKNPTHEAYREFSFQSTPGLYSRLTPQQVCNAEEDSFKQMDIAKRFEFVVQDCRTKLQRGGNTFLSVTIPNHRINGALVAELDRALELEGDFKGLPQVGQRTFIFSREDGKDGLPGGNLVNFGPEAQTYVPARVSHSFSSIPLEGDNGADFGALATEMCQTKMLAEPNHIKAESECNSFGLAVRCIYQGLSYSKYVELANASKMILGDGTELTPDPVKPETYKKLESDFSSKPDILVPKSD